MLWLHVLKHRCKEQETLHCKESVDLSQIGFGVQGFVFHFLQTPDCPFFLLSFLSPSQKIGSSDKGMLKIKFSRNHSFSSPIPSLSTNVGIYIQTRALKSHFISINLNHPKAQMHSTLSELLLALQVHLSDI